ncbi:hypothetical protein HZ326_11302 [Fusarium oxysporum f. sp. albedinis]|nr:hypothetical protein HZ326_11302 [Fusarium oxysporum f. sp. albedinis]KAK2478426.1 hypothetical protein H9L39_10914 [Fusarium oxysporum f. sp. albedinis]RKK41392.1 hypothetical protein BFJ66_g11012 [Fusarium oxysporum f. sp. cepae]
MDGSNARIDLASPVPPWFLPAPPNPQKVGIPTNQLPSISSEEHRDESQKPEKPKIQGKARFSGSLPPCTVTLCSGFPNVSDAGTRYKVPVLEMRHATTSLAGIPLGLLRHILLG